MPETKTTIGEEIEKLLNSFVGKEIATGRKKTFRKVVEVWDAEEGSYSVKYEGGVREYIQAFTSIRIKGEGFQSQPHWEEMCMEEGCTNHFTDLEKARQRDIDAERLAMEEKDGN